LQSSNAFCNLATPSVSDFGIKIDTEYLSTPLSSFAFGTNTLQNNTAQKLLAFKAQGVTHVYLMFDGDEAGEKAMFNLKPLIEECGFIVENINLPDGTDPGELSQEDVDSTREYVTK
jgi:DNA primase